MIKTYLVLPSSNEGENTNGSSNTTNNPMETVPSIENIQPGDPTGPPANQENVAPEEVVRALGQNVETHSSTMKKNLYFVRIRHEMVSRLELEATQNVILSVGLLLLFALPWIISSISALICHGNVVRQVMNDEEGKPEASAVGQCSPYYWAISYTRLILLIAHSIYQSICYVIRSKDLRAALGQSLNKHIGYGHFRQGITNKTTIILPDECLTFLFIFVFEEIILTIIYSTSSIFSYSK